MAGANKVLKEGQVLFKAGDAPDGMYLIRKGELRIYLEQDGKEVTLANVTTGAMIGEMGLFDKQPRSASVKATQATEVTHISMADFSRLMKQIPKWFVGLMSALSGRLRDTNARLQRIEAGGTSSKEKPFRDVGRYLNILTLLWSKDGVKEGREYTLNKKTTEETMINLFDEDPIKLKQFFEILVNDGFISTKRDSYNNVVLSTKNKGVLSQLSNFLTAHAKSPDTAKQRCLPEACLMMLEILENLTSNNPYDSFSISLTDLVKEGKRQGLSTGTWDKSIVAFKGFADGVRLVKMSDGVGLKTSKKEIPSFVRSHKTISNLVKGNLS